jgi:hypothetical protein
MGGDAVSSIVKEVIKGINEGDDKSKKGGSVTKDDVGGEARKNMVDSSAIDVVVAGVIGSPNLFDSQGTEDSITLSAMEIINEKIETIEGSLKKVRIMLMELTVGQSVSFFCLYIGLFIIVYVLICLFLFLGKEFRS